MRHWASLRWDDTQGIKPESLERRARGIAGTLERTKPSGPGKSISVLPFFVSDECWIGEEWLETGVRLLTSGSFDFFRDFLLPLPNADFSGASRRRALYSDSAGFSTGLLKSLADCDGTAVLPGDAFRFWTEHSDRAG